MRGLNLLPWREEQREQQKREFFISLGGSFLTGIILVFLIHMGINNSISHQQEANAYLQSQINDLNVRLKQIADLKEQKLLLMARMKLIQSLEASRPQVVSLFELFVNAMPSGVYVQTIKREGDVITLQGKAQSNTLVSSLMRNIEQYPWVEAPILNEIKSDDNDRDYNKMFTLQFNLKNGLDETASKK
jgi:type IV pilus assembly protein PilN